MNLKKILTVLILFISFNIVSLSSSQAHWHGGWHGSWHGWHGGWHHWGWGWDAPLVVQPYSYYTPYYAGDGVVKANSLIAAGREKIRQGHWYIDHGNPVAGDALINQGQIMIARGNAILGR